MKKLVTLLFAFALLVLPACAATKDPSPPEDTIVDSTQDPFLEEDDIVDSTQDIVIDFAAFLEERNAAHKVQLDEKYTEEFFKTYGPDFYEELNLVSEEEAGCRRQPCRHEHQPDLSPHQQHRALL